MIVTLKRHRLLTIGLAVLVEIAVVLVIAKEAAVSRLPVVLVGLVAALLIMHLWKSSEAILPTALAAYVAVPFVTVMEFLQPEQYNYGAYAAAFLLVAGILGVMRRGLPRLRPALLFLLFLSGSVLTRFWALKTTGTYQLLIMPAAALGLYLSLQAEGERGSQSFAIALGVLCAVESSIGISQVLFGTPIFARWGTLLYSGDRNYLGYLLPGVSTLARQASGTFEHFNGLGALLAFGTPVIFGAIFDSTKRRWIWLLSFGFSSLGLVLTFSRGSLLGAMAGLIYVWFFYEIKRRGVVNASNKLMAILLGMALVFLTLIPVITAYVSRTGNIGVREATWTTGLRLLKQSPWHVWFGFGLGYFNEAILGRLGTATRLHSSELQAFLELGLSGAGLLLITIMAAFRNAAHSSSFQAHAMVGGVLGFLVSQTVDNSLFGWTGVLLFGALGAIEGLTRIKTSSDSNGR